jgi:hypothetical protein
MDLALVCFKKLFEKKISLPFHYLSFPWTRTKPDSSSRHTPRNEGKKIRVAIPDDLPLLGENR